MRLHRSFNLQVAIATAAVVAVLALVLGDPDGHPLALRNAGWYVRTLGTMLALTIALPVLARRVAPHPPSPDERALAAARHWRALRERVAKVLLRDWDPLDVQEVGPADEYDDCVGSVLSLLVGGASERRLVDHLAHLQLDVLGLTHVDRAHLHAVARTLRGVDLGDLDPDVEPDPGDAALWATPPSPADAADAPDTLPHGAVPGEPITVTLRPIRPDDHAAIRGLAADAFGLYTTTPSSDVGAMLDDHMADAIVAVTGDLVCGFAIVAADAESRRGPPWGAIRASLNAIAVAPALQRRGIARAMLREIEQIACARGARAIVLETATTNVAAQALFRAGGFAAGPRVPGVYSGSVDALVMVKLLPPTKQLASSDDHSGAPDPSGRPDGPTKTPRA